MQNTRILLIEDEMELSNAIKVMLDLNNYDTIVAENGKKGLDILTDAKIQVELVICDINLPDINGHDILKEIRNNRNLFKIPFIFLSAFSDEQDIREGMNKGADDYLTKPFKIAALLNTIKSRLEISRKSKQFLETETNDKWLGILNDSFKQEFITPLNGILNATHLIENGIHSGSQALAEHSETIGAIYNASFRMLRNTRNLLIYSALSENRFKTTNKWPDDIELGDMLEQILSHYNKLPINGSGGISCQIDEIPTWQGEAEYTNVILTELIDNAVKYNSTEDAVEISLTKTEIGFEFSVVNGIAEGLDFVLESVQPFKKFHDNLSHNSLGLGLYTSKRLCYELGYPFSMHIEGNRIKFSVSVSYNK